MGAIEGVFIVKPQFFSFGEVATLHPHSYQHEGMDQQGAKHVDEWPNEMGPVHLRVPKCVLVISHSIQVGASHRNGEKTFVKHAVLVYQH
jgi:hypothetical protein